MVVVVSALIVWIYECRGVDSNAGRKASRTAAAIRDSRTQAVLVLAGLRGAVSLALVENVPIYNTVTGEGCEFKQLMKGMTSAAILFTTFVFGGGGYYILPHLGVSPEHALSPTGADSSTISSNNIPQREVLSAPIRPPTTAVGGDGGVRRLPNLNVSDVALADSPRHELT